MSGIAGIYYLDGRPVGAELDRMVEAMEHRGRDGTDTWRDGSVGLGHLMLETTPEDQYESLPLIDRSGHFAITADARIDNRDELITTLDVRVPEDRPITDAELILAAYKRWGRDCPKKLLGAFAFAVWDARNQTLTLARDHFGIRPLHYARRSRHFAFSSEEKALIRAGFSEGEVNELKVADYLMLPVKIEPDATYWEDIFSVLRAHTLRVNSKGEVDQERYWKLKPDRETKLGSDADYIERFQELFREAVRCRMRRTTPLGSTLSGGLDSTFVACTAAQELTGEKLHTFSAVHPSIPKSDEREYQEAALQMYRDEMEPTFIAADETSPLEYADWFTQHLGLPNDGVNSFIMIEVYRHAVENNLRVVLSGNDGDTVVSHGRAYYNELLWSGRWIELWQDLRERVNALGGSNNDVKRALIGWVKYYLRNSPLTKPLVNAFQTVTRNGSTRAEDEDGIKARQEGGAWRRGWRPYFDEQFIRSVKPHSEAHPSGRQWTTERKHHHMLLTRPLMESAFRKFDALANGLGMEIRFPFHDVRLVEFCLSLPGHLKRRGKWTRWIEHAAMEDIVPPEIQARHDKTDARWVYTNGLTEYESDTLSSFSKILSEGSSPVSRYVDCNRASDLALKMANGNLSQRDQESERILLWRILSLHKWMEMYYDEKNPQSVDYEAV